MNNTQNLIQRYLNGLATPAQVHELNALAAEQGVALEEFIIEHGPETFEDDFEDIDITQNEFSPQDFYDQRLSDALREYRRKKKEAKVIPIKRGGHWLNVAAAVIAIVLTVGLLYYKQHRLALDHPVSESQDVNILTTFKGKQFIVLPDSSTVILNEGSELSYDESYGAELRAVTLTGEGFFDVRSNSGKKFIVQSGNVTTSVLGTAFNVKAFPGDQNILVTVSRGKVAVQDDKQFFGTITPNEQIIVSDNGTCIHGRVDAEQETAWMAKHIIINNQRFEEAVKKVSLAFNVPITIEKDNLKNCTITIAFLENPELESVLKVLSTAISASYTIEQNGSVTIKGGECHQ